MRDQLISLKFKTDNELLIALCSKYWEQNEDCEFVNKVPVLYRKFKIPAGKLNKLITDSCEAFTDSYVCSDCKVPYIFSSRFDYKLRGNGSKSWKCSKCLLAEEERKEQERINRQKQFRRIVEEKYKIKNRVPADTGLLSFEEAVFLLAFIRLYAAEDYSFARPVSSARDRLAPTDNYCRLIVETLFKRKLILVDPGSPVEAFCGEQAERFYIYEVMWKLPYGILSEDPRDFAIELEAYIRLNLWPERWHDESICLWRNVALSECLQYLNFSLQEHGFNFSPGDKTISVLNNLLNDYSTSQIFNIIWRSVKDAAAYYVREHVPRIQAANFAIGAMQRFGDKAKAEGWIIRPYSRPWLIPQTEVSFVLYNTALKIGDLGFMHVPDVSLLTKDNH